MNKKDKIEKLIFKTSKNFPKKNKLDVCLKCDCYEEDGHNYGWIYLEEADRYICVECSEELSNLLAIFTLDWLLKDKEKKRKD